MTDLPTGTVTLLFTDIEGSTRLLHELGERYVEVLAEHRRALREAFAAHDGVEVDTQGDAFFVAFARAQDALAAARDAQAALSTGPARARIGIHTGEPQLTNEGYVGIDVHRAARVMAAGHGGQVLVSEATRVLVAEQFPLRDLGPHRLKDMTAPQHLYQAGGGDFPPLKSLNQTNLPVAASALIGRERELAELVAMLRDGARVVTVTGAGGSGKTRLALQAAAELVDDFPGGVHWVPLAGLADPQLVLPGVAQTLGATDDLQTHLADRETLLLLDNFEHVLEAAAQLAELLAHAPATKVLATSRAPLRIDGEREFALDPLVEPDALAFFVARAGDAGLRLDADETVREICLRLDRLPLALELAAARAKLLGPERLLARLDERLPLLTGGRRDAPERQQTLRATIEWSHDLLDERARQLFAQLSVFAGGFSLEAAERVAAADLETLAELVDLNLVKSTGDGRFLMLETIAEYARERLEPDEGEDVRRAHAEYLVGLLELANLSSGTELEMRHEVAIVEQDNARAALDWAQASDPVLGLRVAIALELFWATHSPLEGIARLQALLEHVESPALRAAGLRSIGGAADPVGQNELAERMYEQSLALYRSLGDETGIAHLLMRLAHSAYYRGDLGASQALADESLALHRRHGLAMGEMQVETLLGRLDIAAGNVENGLAKLETCARQARELGFAWWEVVTLVSLADEILASGLCPDPEAHVRRGVEVAERIGNHTNVVYGLLQLARIAADRGDAQRAGRLWGAVEAETERRPPDGWDPDESEHTVVLRGLSGPAFERALAVGRSHSLEEAVADALSAS